MLVNTTSDCMNFLTSDLKMEVEDIKEFYEVEDDRLIKQTEDQVWFSIYNKRFSDLVEYACLEKHNLKSCS